MLLYKEGSSFSGGPSTVLLISTGTLYTLTDIPTEYYNDEQPLSNRRVNYLQGVFVAAASHDDQVRRWQGNLVEKQEECGVNEREERREERKGNKKRIAM